VARTPSQNQLDAIAEAERIATGVTPSPTRLADLAGGIGKKLELIKGKEVTVTSIEVTMRDVRAIDPDENGEFPIEQRDLAIITVQPQPGFEDHPPERYYTFARPLIEKLKAVPAESLPAVAVFEIEDIKGGRRVWTIS
jgi:hypothetical protein